MRTTAGQVQATLQRDYDTKRKPNLIPYIKRASLVVDRVVTCAASRVPPVVMTDDELTDIETLLACHFYQTMDRGFQQKSTDNASGSFLGQTGKGFEGSWYGQDALRLDYSGCLEAIDKRKVARGFWGGTPHPCPSNGFSTGQGVTGVFGDNP
jgi:hypothetical protein